jgi:hypothetical protein
MSKEEKNVESGEKRGKKRGPAPGTKYKTTKVSMNDWYHACEAYSAKGKKPKMKDFLRSDESGPNFFGTKSEVVGLSNKLKLYREDKVKPTDA